MKIVQFLIVLVLAGGAAAGAWYLSQLTPRNDAYYGYVEGEYVHFAAPVSGNLQALAVRRGQRVEAGTALFAIDDTVAKADVAGVMAKLERARAELADLELGARPEELKVRTAEIAEAKAAFRIAELDLKRQQELRGSTAAVEARLDSARANRDEAEARVQALQSAYSVAKLPARINRVDAARQAVLEAEAALAASNHRLVELAPAAFAPAVVQDSYYLPGAWVPANMAVVSLLPDDKRKLRFYVPQSDIAKIAVGSAVNFSCDGCSEGLSATVSFIAPEAEYTPPVIYSAASREKLVFLVEATLTGAALLPVGLPVEVEKAP